jgi:hypothetical protein
MGGARIVVNHDCMTVASCLGIACDLDGESATRDDIVAPRECGKGARYL